MLDPGREFERYQEGYNPYPPYQLDQYAPRRGRRSSGSRRSLPPTRGAVLPIDETGAAATPVQYWVPWVAADGTVYDGGEAGCVR